MKSLYAPIILEKYHFRRLIKEKTIIYSLRKICRIYLHILIFADKIDINILILNE